MVKSKYTVVRDTREKSEHGYVFGADDYFTGTVSRALATGDYALDGFEKGLVIERKESVAEYAGNACDPRFFRELERFDDISRGFLILEFYLDDIMLWPTTSGIPKHKLPFVKTTNKFLLLKFNEIQMNYNIKTMFVGPYGKAVVHSLFRRFIEKVESGN